jgi:hypothetical protein
MTLEWLGTDLSNYDSRWRRIRLGFLLFSSDKAGATRASKTTPSFPLRPCFLPKTLPESPRIPVNQTKHEIHVLGLGISERRQLLVRMPIPGGTVTQQTGKACTHVRLQLGQVRTGVRGTSSVISRAQEHLLRKFPTEN